MWADVCNWGKEDIDLEVPDDVKTQPGSLCPLKNPFIEHILKTVCAHA